MCTQPDAPACTAETNVVDGFRPFSYPPALFRDTMKKSRIDDVIADGFWRLPDAMRKLRRGRRTAYIAIGRPRPDGDPRGDWICPIQIEHFTDKALKARGVGPLDALLNAVSLLNQFFYMNTLASLEPAGKRKPPSAPAPRRK